VSASFLLLFLFLLLDLLDELVELRLGVLGELHGVTLLDALALVHNHHVVAVDDGVDPVGDGDHCGVLEVVIHQLLDLLFSHDVDVSSGLIQHDNFVLSQDSSGDTDQLLFTSTQAFGVELKVDAHTVSKLVVFDIHHGVGLVSDCRSTFEDFF